MLGPDDPLPRAPQRILVAGTSGTGKTTMHRLVRRTLRRRLRREELWHGNVEPPLWTILTDRDHVVRRAWRTRAKCRRLAERIRDDHPHLTFVRLRSQAETDRWMRALTASAAR